MKILEVFGFKGSRFPSWTSKMAVYLDGGWVGLNNLMEIKLSNCEECENIPMLGHLPHLKSLYLSHLKNVKCIGSSFYGDDSCSSNNDVRKKKIIVFPTLQRLELLNLPNLTKWLEAESQPDRVEVFPYLEYLEIRKCKELRSAPSQLPCLKELYIEEMDSGLPLANICGIRLTTLIKLNIRRVYGLICLPDWLFTNNQNLSELLIISCPNLRKLPDGLHTLNSLELLMLVRCQNLKSIPYSSRGEQSQNLRLLHSLSVIDCERLINLPFDMIESCALSLKDLRLERLSNVTNLAMIIECLHKMPRLKELIIVDVPTLSTSSSIKTNTFCSLQDLTIGPTSDLSDSVSFKKAVDGILQLGCESLRRLELFGMEDWDSLPNSLQHLSALSWLELYKFEIEELPEWFGNLLSLKTLYLHDCKKLRCLPSVEAMRRLTKLTYLTIEGCPVLKQRCIAQQNGDDDDDSEWPKVSRISFICVDGRPIQFFGRSWDS